MKLIQEDVDFHQTKVLVEGTGANKKLFISGPFLQAEKVNRNKRVYPQKVMDEAVKKYIKDYVEKNRALGELNHPPEPIVNPERAAIMTTELKKDGIYYIGKAKVLSTPKGKIVESLLNDGVTIGVSSRGLGSLKKNMREGFNEVQSDFILTTAADVVFDPSAQEAFVEGIFEGAEWLFESGVCRRVELEEQQAILKHAKKQHLTETKLKLWQQFLNHLKQ